MTKVRPVNKGIVIKVHLVGKRHNRLDRQRARNNKYIYKKTKRGRIYP